MTLERMLKNCGDETKRSRVDPEKLQLTVLKSKEAFLKSEEEGETAWLEFLYQQAGYIQKRWWLGQGALLFGLWMILYMSGSSPDIQRSAGILASAFVILALPELWKNRSSHSMEVEGAAYFSLRKIYAARLLLFGAADVFLLSVFFAVSLFSLKIETADLLIQFILPMNVTCGICFGTLESKKHMSLFSSLTLCLFWTAAWFLLVSSDGLYERITMPVWMGVLLFSFFFLSWSVWRLWKKCQNYYEVCET